MSQVNLRFLIWLLAITLPVILSGFLVLTGYTDQQTALLLLLVSVLLMAVKFGQPPAIVNALASLVCFNYFFTDPAFTLMMDHTEDIVAAVIFFLVAILIGHQTQVLKQQNLDEIEIRTTLEKTTLEKDREVLRTALMSSLSHDLKTPLVTMIGATSSLIELDDKLTDDDKKELLNSVLEESKRLERYIQNLLDMTRLGYNGLSIDRQFVNIVEIIQTVKLRICKDHANAALVLKCPENLPEVEVHPALIEQALYNLTENAVKFSPQGEVVIISCHTEENNLVIDIIDKGPGISNDLRDSAFDLFNTLGRGDRHKAGEGLGLAIAKGMVGAHQGKLLILDPLNYEHGTCMRVVLPIHNRSV